MKKKDFTKDAAPVYDPFDALAAPEAQEEPKTTPAQKAREGLRTQGNHRGEKLDRINMAFTPENIDFIRTMARLKGQTMTLYLNTIIAEERERNGAAYEAAKALLENL